jgi:hypothetical protein
MLLLPLTSSWHSAYLVKHMDIPFSFALPFWICGLNTKSDSLYILPLKNVYILPKNTTDIAILA